MDNANLRLALTQENPLQIVGTINAYTAMLAQNVGFRAIYLSGAGVANASYGLPDLGITNLTDVLEDVRRIKAVCPLPLLVDADTGWGNAFNIQRTVKSFIAAEAAGIHLEDQVNDKRCGHRPGKKLVETTEMCDRIKAAVDARTDPNFVIMARTDALASEGLDQTMERIRQYIAVGADMIFFEGATTVDEYTQVVKNCSVPVLANMTEFGISPLLTKDQLKQCGIQLILYPLSAFRGMAFAALEIFKTIREKGSQESLLNKMQTRQNLYEILDYYKYENRLDLLFAKGNN